MNLPKILKNIVNFPSDKNGCGFYRTLIPFGFLSTKLDWNVSFMYQFIFDLNLIRSANYIRFQRQCTDNQKRCVQEYRRCIDVTKSKSKIVYELDDIVHGIEPSNILAYQFYTKSRQQNVVDLMKMSDVVTFSTQFLKDFYQREFGINNSTVIPNLLPKFLWMPDFNKDKKPYKKKPVVMWAGSGSHVAPGGDLEFLIPMIQATIDEFEWSFVGCIPPVLEPLKASGKISFTPWSNFYEYPQMMQSLKADIAIAPIKDNIFNYAKSDLKYIEYAAMNIPSICSKIGNGKGPYDLTNALLVDNTPDDWYSAIKELSKDETRQKSIIKTQHEYIKNRWLEDDNSINIYNQTYS